MQKKVFVGQPKNGKQIYRYTNRHRKGYLKADRYTNTQESENCKKNSISIRVNQGFFVKKATFQHLNHCQF